MKPIFFLVLCAAPAALFSQTPPATILAEPGEVIVSTPFDQPAPPTRKGKINGWQAAIGEWTVKDGALHGDELASDNHPSSCTFRTEAGDLIIKAQFKLGAAEQIAFGCRDTVAPNLHLARTVISRNAVWIQKMSGISKTTRSEKLVELKTALDPEAWHDLTIEIIGDHYQARIGEQIIEARHERFKDTKGLIALIVKGQGAQFKNVSLWRAKPKAAATK